jgi:hypothetical protein
VCVCVCVPTAAANWAAQSEVYRIVLKLYTSQELWLVCVPLVRPVLCVCCGVCVRCMDIRNFIIYPIIDNVVPLNGNKLSHDASVFFRTTGTNISGVCKFCQNFVSNCLLLKYILNNCIIVVKYLVKGTNCDLKGTTQMWPEGHNTGCDLKGTTQMWPEGHNTNVTWRAQHKCDLKSTTQTWPEGHNTGCYLKGTTQMWPEGHNTGCDLKGTTQLWPEGHNTGCDLKGTTQLWPAGDFATFFSSPDILRKNEWAEQVACMRSKRNCLVLFVKAEDKWPFPNRIAVGVRVESKLISGKKRWMVWPG